MPADHVSIPVYQCPTPGSRKGAVLVGAAKVDAADAQHAGYFWTLHVNGYAYRRCPERRRNVYLHREIAGSPQRPNEIAHGNADKLDCRRSNLSVATRSNNLLNPNDRIRRNNASGFRGVACHHSATGRAYFVGWLTVRHRAYHTPSFDRPEDAAAALAEIRAQVGVAEPTPRN